MRHIVEINLMNFHTQNRNVLQSAVDLRKGVGLILLFYTLTALQNNTSIREKEHAYVFIFYFMLFFFLYSCSFFFLTTVLKTLHTGRSNPDRVKGEFVLFFGLPSTV